MAALPQRWPLYCAIPSRAARREAMSGNTRTVTAPPVTIVDAMVVEIRTEEDANWVTAKVIGRAVAEDRPRADRSRGVLKPKGVVQIEARSTTGARRTRAITATKRRSS